MGDTGTSLVVSSDDNFDLELYQQAIVIAELETIGKYDLSPPFEIGSEEHLFFRDILMHVYRKLLTEKEDAD